LIGLTVACSLPSYPGSDSGPDIQSRDTPFDPPDNFVPPDGDLPGFAITSVEPSRGPIRGGTAIEITGFGFIPDSTVVVGSTEAIDVVVQNDRSILATTPSHPAGFVPVTVTRPDGKNARLEQGFFYEAVVSVAEVVPDSGPATGGTPITVRGTGFSKDARILVGGRIAMNTRFLDPGTLLAITPPGTAGPRDVLVTGSTGQAAMRRAFTYMAVPEGPDCDPPVVRLDSISPGSGPLDGGTPITLRGKGFDQIRQVFVGSLPARIVAGPSSTSVRVINAPGSPGLHDVTAITERGCRIVLKDAFVYGARDPDLVAVVPATGAIAGGTLVSIAGSGFSREVTVRFGLAPAIIEDASDPARLRVRTPPASGPGVVDVAIAWPDGTTRTLSNSFTYFDPTGYFGGIWGEQIDGSVNVTVLDSYNGRRVPFAFVMVDSDPFTPYKGRTNADGQIVLSGDTLFGPLMVTATREDYGTFSFLGVDAENLSIYIDPMVPSIPDGGGGGGITVLPPGLVTGRVLGADKALLAPPEPCGERPLIHGILCHPCTADSDCGLGASCEDVAGSGRHCATECAVDDNCPEGYSCYSSTRGGACMPSPGRIEIRCEPSVRGMFAYPPNPGPGAIADAAMNYAISSRLGNVAVQCVGGVRRHGTGELVPVALGLSRFVPVYPSQITSDRDMWLSIPLDRDLEVRLLNAPGGPGGPNDHSLLASLDLGSDGILKLWPIQGGLDTDLFRIPNLPRDFTGDLEGAELTLYAEAVSPGANTLPYSVSVIRGWSPGKGPGMVEVRNGAAQSLGPDIRPDATGGCGLSSGGAMILAPRGRSYRLDQDGLVQAAPSLGTRTFRACIERNGVITAVGDAGNVVRVQDDIVAREITDTARDLGAIAATTDGTLWAAGDGVLLRRDQDSIWRSVPFGANGALNALVAGGNGTLLAFGERGLTVRVSGGIAAPVLPYPGERDFHAATLTGGFLVMAVGKRGTAVLMDFEGEAIPIPAGTWNDLTAVATVPGGDVIAVGSRGTILRFDGSNWHPVPVAGFTGEASTLVPGRDGALIVLSRDAVSIGPFLDVADFTTPINGLPWLHSSVAWTRDAPPHPSFTYTRIYGTKSVGSWTVLGDGPVQEFELPDIAAAGGQDLPGLPTGDVRIRSIHVLKDGFTINRYDSNDLSSNAWRSWTVQDVIVTR
jgi:hypothetical protein